MTRSVRIATRGSQLALWQAEHVAARLRSAHPSLTVELVKIASAGDLDRDRPIAQIGVGVFTKEIQAAILDGRADIAVHSLKDLPTIPIEGIELAAVPERAAPFDALLAPVHQRMVNIPQGGRIATSSLRRRSQLLKARPDLRVESIRGNVETRIRKAIEAKFDGLILARAGLDRLGLAEHITEDLSPEFMLPAVGQGALGIECRAEDAGTKELLQTLEHPATRAAVTAERAFLAVLQGGCQVPAGALGTLDEDGALRLRATVLSTDGQQSFSGNVTGKPSDAHRIGTDLARRLLADGADQILRV
jgi:hydroxymethylbilane synthase